MSRLPSALPAAAPPATRPRRLPMGAEPLPGGGVHFRAWAPRRQRVEVLCESPVVEIVELAAEGDGWFAGTASLARPGTRYRLRLDGQVTVADPASRFQPEGPHGPSEVVDPGAFVWNDGAWRGLATEGQVLYELHVGSFTREGSWSAAARELTALAALGVTAVELMPVADFPGRFGWGYDGVNWFAPSRLYGRPDDFRRFVDRAHALGIGVLLDVVYNHFGPDGCTLHEFGESWFSTRHHSEWGASPNFDGAGSTPVREAVLANVAHWIDEYHLDGLRLDATQSVHDDSRPHILQQIGQRARAAAGRRRVIVVGENEPQDAALARLVADGGQGLDMLWNDDWHHSAHVAATGEDEAYRADYRGRPQEFVSAARHGFLFQGQWSRWQQQRRGTPARELRPWQFVHFLENHDQVANSAHGRRLHQCTSPARWRALTALLLLGPQTPMLFQGQEFACSAPFLYFADHVPALAVSVQQGRRTFMAQFAPLAGDAGDGLPPPHAPATFERCRIDHRERTHGHHQQAWQMHRDLLALRRTDPCLVRAQRDRRQIEGAVLGEEAFVLRFLGDDGDDRLLLVNLGRTLHLDPAPEPLLAPSAGARGWRLLWSSQSPGYGGLGDAPVDAAQTDRTIAGRTVPRPFENWRVPGETAVLLAQGG